MNIGSTDFIFGFACGMLLSCFVAGLTSFFVARAYKRQAGRRNA